MINLDIADVVARTGVRNDITSVDIGCHTYVLIGESSCGYAAPYSSLYINGRMAPVEYQEVEEGTENDSGIFTRTFWAVKAVMSMDVMVNNQSLRWLQLMKGYDTLKIQKVGGSSQEIRNLQISAPSDEMGDYFLVTLTFEDPDIIEQSGCCGGAFDGAPFEDPCPPEWGGEPDPNDPCTSFEVDVVYDDESIKATVMGGGGGTVKYKWYYDAQGSGNNFNLIAEDVSVIVPEGAGIYRVVATKGACQAVDAVMIQDACSLFEVILSYELGMIRSRIIAGQGEAEYTWTYIDNEANEEVLSDDGDSIHPEKTGFYRLDVEDGDCEDSDTIYIEVVDTCDFEVNIIDNGDGTYTAVPEGLDEEESFSVVWEKETTAGTVDYGTDETITPDEEGVYHAIITADGCEERSYVLAMGLCVQFKAFISAIVPSSNHFTLYAETINAPASVDFLWYQYTGGAYVLIGSGQSVQTTQVGAVKLVAMSGMCRREDVTQVPIDFDSPWYYQRFDLLGGEDHVEVTEFTLPDIENTHPDRVAYLMEVTENGVEQVYGHEVLPGDLHRLEYSIDGQNVQLNPAYTRAGSIIVVKMKKE